MIYRVKWVNLEITTLHGKEPVLAGGLWGSLGALGHTLSAQRLLAKLPLPADRQGPPEHAVDGDFSFAMKFT